MLSVVMLSVVMLSAIMLSVVPPSRCISSKSHGRSGNIYQNDEEDSNDGGSDGEDELRLQEVDGQVDVLVLDHML
jgi:hypothetical protein